MKKALIITGGSVSHPFFKSHIEENDYDLILGVDRGNEALLALSIRPDIALGDMDSVSDQVLDQLKALKVNIKQYNPIKDSTDTAIAFEQAKALGVTHVDLIGATGTRLDHMMSTVLLLEQYIDIMEVHLIDPNNDLTYHRAPLNQFLLKQEGYTYFSLVPISKEVNGVTYEGAKYPLSKATVFRELSLGISNEWLNPEVYMDVAEGLFLLIRSKD